MKYDILLCGVGGQGVLSIAAVIASAAMADGLYVRQSEVHGMSQRGGSVESHVRFGKGVHSPLLGAGQSDFLLCFHEDEHTRLGHFLNKDGVDLFDWLNKAKAMVDNPKALNTALTGVLAAYLPIKDQSWDKAIETVFPEKLRESNKAIFHKARNAAQTELQ